MSSSLENLKKTINAIRDPETGCVWNLAQTHSSLKRYLLEELYEALEAIDKIEEKQDYKDLKEELGDLFLQIILHAKLAEEQGKFTLDEVFDDLNTKMIKRHPHVFKREDSGGATNTAEVDKHWDREKAKEKQQRESIFEGIPLEMPALARAWKISKKAVKESFEWDEEYKLWDQLRSEMDELLEVVDDYRTKSGIDPHKEGFSDAKTQEEAELELGDILFTVVNIARWYKIDPEEALRKTNNKFIKRFDEMVKICKSESKTLRDYSVPELEELWQKAKKRILMSS